VGGALVIGFSRILSLCVISLAASGWSCGRPASESPPETLRLLAGGPVRDDVLARLRAAVLPHADVSLDGVPGSVLVVSGLQQGHAEIGFAQADVVYSAYRMGLPGDARPHTRLRGIAVSQSVNTYLVVRRDSPYKKVSDLKHRRIGVTPTGTYGRVYAHMIFEAFGLDETLVDFKSYPYEEMTERLRDGSVDAVTFGGGGIPQQMIAANQAVGIRLIDLRGDAVTKLRGRYPFFNRVLVTAADLPGQSGDAQTLGVDNLLVCRQELTDERVYKLTRGFLEASSNATGTTRFRVDPDRAAATPIPLHAGAARYYREREVLQ
jgi:TRAP transporter TAXI family solute receptor